MSDVEMSDGTMLSLLVSMVMLLTIIVGSVTALYYVIPAVGKAWVYCSDRLYIAPYRMTVRWSVMNAKEERLLLTKAAYQLHERGKQSDLAYFQGHTRGKEGVIARAISHK